MALATRCPACSTIFRISTAQAAAKGGMVRCGHCRHVFNSLDALVRVEELDILDEEEIAPQPDAAIDAETQPPASEPVAVDPEPQSEPAGKAVFSEWWLPEVAADSVRTPVTDDGVPAEGPPSASAVADSADRDFGGQTPTGRRTGPGPDAGEAPAPEFLQEPVAAPPRSRRETWLMGGLASVALLFLLAQAVYVWRNEIATRFPEAKPLLVAACAPLRCLVDYPAHPQSITIEATAVQTAAPGNTPGSNRYVLNALLRNRDANAIRYPHLELVLTDVQDQPIFRRALRPEDYLPGNGPAGGFAAQSELPIRLTFELDDLRFAGYRLESFYP